MVVSSVDACEGSAKGFRQAPHRFLVVRVSSPGAAFHVFQSVADAQAWLISAHRASLVPLKYLGPDHDTVTDDSGAVHFVAPASAASASPRGRDWWFVVAGQRARVRAPDWTGVV